MHYLYHYVPNDLQGDTLYPLNELKNRYPEIYQQEVAKYVGREQIMDRVIPRLNCLWNDVLHFAPVHPAQVKQALNAVGFPTARKYQTYEIPATQLEPNKTVIYLYQHPNTVDQLNPDNFIPYDPQLVRSYTELPEATKAYYKESFAERKRPLLYHRVPHILYHGSLKVTDLPVITV